MKKILLLIYILSASFVLYGQDANLSIENTYFRITDRDFESQLFFLDNGNLILKPIVKDIYSRREPLLGRYIRQADQILLAPLHRQGFFEVAYRHNQDVKKNKVRLTFKLAPDAEEMYYAFQNDTLTDDSSLTALVDLIKEPKHTFQDITVEKDYCSTLILKKTDGRDQFVMTYEIPADANDVYIDYFGFYGESAMLYLFNVKHDDGSNELTLNYNMRGEEQEPPVQAYYIRPVAEEDYSGIIFPPNELQYGYSYLDPSDFYYYKKSYEDELEASIEEPDNDYEEEIVEEPIVNKNMTDKERRELLHYNKTTLEPIIRSKGKPAKKAAEEYFLNVLKVKENKYTDYNNAWTFLCNDLFDDDTSEICPSTGKLDELLNIYAENELRSNKFDTLAARIIYRYYSEIYYCNELMPAQLPASVHYFMKYAKAMHNFGLSKADESKGVWYMMETLIQCIDMSDNTEKEQVYKEILQLAPDYSDFLMLSFSHMVDWNSDMLVEYLNRFKGWDLQKFREHNEYLKKLEPSYYGNYSMRKNGHPVGFCGELGWLLNRVATDIYMDSWREKSPYLANAVEWAGLSTEMCAPSMLPEYLDTYACLLYQTGEKAKALEMSNLALKSLTEEQHGQFISRMIKVNNELIKQNRLTSEQAWLLE